MNSKYCVGKMEGEGENVGKNIGIMEIFAIFVTSESLTTISLD